jgi:hypothetical protein
LTCSPVAYANRLIYDGPPGLLNEDLLMLRVSDPHTDYLRPTIIVRSYASRDAAA